MIPYILNEPVQIKNLDEHSFKGVQSGQVSACGWTEPVLISDDLSYQYEDIIVLKFKREEKNLPSAEIKRRLDDQVKTIETGQLRKVYKKERDQLKDEVILSMLPHAFSKFKEFNIYIYSDKYIFVDVDNAKDAEQALSFLRGTLGSLSVSTVDVARSPRAVVSLWVQHDEYPQKIHPSDTYMCITNNEGGEDVFKNQPYCDDDIVNCMEGLPYTKEIGLIWDDSYTFKFNESFILKSVKETDRIINSRAESVNASVDPDTHQINCNMWVYCTNMARLVDTLIKSFN